MSDRTEDLQPILDRLVQGDPGAKRQIIEMSLERLRRLARKLLRCDPRIARWEQTDDILNSAVMRLERSLDAVKPETVKGFIGLAATQMRRELTDLARHHYGPMGHAAHYESDAPRQAEGKEGKGHKEPVSPEKGPSTLVEWKSFYEKCEELPTDEREVFDFLFIQDLSQEETARRLGIDKRTVQRRWRSAKMNLARLLRGEIPKM